MIPAMTSLRGPAQSRCRLVSLVVAALAAVLSAAPAARAADAPDDKTSKAKVLWQEANSHYAVGEFNAAAEKYQAAYKLKADAALLYNAAQSYRLAGNNEKALLLYKNYVMFYPNAQERLERGAADREAAGSHRRAAEGPDAAADHDRTGWRSDGGYPRPRRPARRAAAARAGCCGAWVAPPDSRPPQRPRPPRWSRRRRRSRRRRSPSTRSGGCGPRSARSSPRA